MTVVVATVAAADPFKIDRFGIDHDPDVDRST